MHEYAAQLRQEDCRPGRTVLPLVEQFSAPPDVVAGNGVIIRSTRRSPYDQAFDRFARDAQTHLGAP